MTRREVLALLAGVAVNKPISAKPQPSERLRVIGVLIALAENDADSPPRIAEFQRGMQELGWSEGLNIRAHFRFSVEADQLQKYAKELVALQPDVIIASSGLVVFALLRETRTIPIIFVTSSDPIGDGFVTSLARPGGNVTGFTNNLATMGGKWVELLKEIAPATERAAILYNPVTAPSRGSYYLPNLEASTKTFGWTTVPLPVANAMEIESGLAAFARERGGALIVMPDTFTAIHREVIVSSAARYRIPAIYPARFFTVAGGLISYGVNLRDVYRRVPTLVDRILKGANPAEIPVQAPAKIDLAINLKTARMLGLSVPRIMLARADEVIE